MTSTNLTLSFDGQSISDGQIDIQDLTQSLIAFGELMQASNKVINGDKVNLSVKVVATQKGSFEIEFGFIQSMLEIAKSFLDFSTEHKEEITNARNLIETIFLATAPLGVIGGGLFALIKWLNGRKPDSVENNNDKIHIHIGDNYFIIDKTTAKLAENIQVREHARRMVSVLDKQGIDRLKFSIKDGNDLIIDKSDIASFNFEVEESLLSDEIRTMNLQIISLSFKEENKWRVTDGKESFSANIEDEAYLKGISQNDVSFSKGDILKCEIQERQFSSPKGLRTEVTIKKVINHFHAAKQLHLF